MAGISLKEALAKRGEKLYIAKARGAPHQKIHAKNWVEADKALRRVIGRSGATLPSRKYWSLKEK